MTALIIICSIIAFFVLLFSVRVRVDLKMDDVLRLSVRVFGIKINILPKKPKKYSLRKYTLKKIRARDAKAEAKERKKAEAKAKKKKEKAEAKKKKAAMTKAEKKAVKAKKRASTPPIPDMISLFKDVLSLFFSSFFSKFHFHIAKVIIRVGSDSADKTATLHGAVCTALAPVLTFIDRHTNLHTKKNFTVYIEPDFLSDKITADIDIGFSMSLGGVLSALIKAGVKFIVGWVKIKPSAPDTEGAEHGNSNEK